MKKSFIATAIGLGLLASGGTATANTLTFNEASGSPFTQYLWVTPDAPDDLGFFVSGPSSQFDALSFLFVAVPGLPVTMTASGGTRKASFDDMENTQPQFSLNGGEAYLVKVFGLTRAGIVGGHGTVTVSVIGTAIPAVPEPESYAMLLAGLGLLGLIARRRAKAAA
jgi:hypothetical protein